ncbi:hypothetical protein ZHAS_00018542 [Anopheles sinensis]|uniref:Uncharacterized protein n=1 Tax=Anopheles sinensis TaxID=74873 RepID=A0A084WJV9_ANOSI|nr:hypothetical protein ZHAS_00018542 [Anopheles sinensis]
MAQAGAERRRWSAGKGFFGLPPPGGDGREAIDAANSCQIYHSKRAPSETSLQPHTDELCSMAQKEPAVCSVYRTMSAPASIHRSKLSLEHRVVGKPRENSGLECNIQPHVSASEAPRVVGEM